NEIGDLYDKDNKIEPAPNSKNKIRVVASRSHMNPETRAFMTDLNKEYGEVEIMSKGSSLKFCLVAEGKADIYPRFAPTMEWDTAAGQAICNSVGLKVISQEGSMPLTYNCKNLLNPYFLVHK
ncbi:MAG: 3'(2'),5'-bisphosphate nucleotidase CysQ, partial [Eudoraea sp.]|nr:3'(2'),5'-bisphosphate nucleotidase CysQ [Eudoraea sp.]